MDSLRIRNLRSLKDTGEIKFKKINIFVGQNSSGKSSFIRTLPLLKQSAQVKTVSDILWYGPFVDFGSFDEALSRNAEENLIEFSFTMQAWTRRTRYRTRSAFRPTTRTIPIKFSLSIRPDRDKKINSLVTQYNINIFNQNILLILDENLNIQKFSCNDIDFTAEGRNEFFFRRTFGLIPGVRNLKEFSENGSAFDQKIAKVIENNVHGNKSKNEKLNISFELGFTSPEELLTQLKSIKLGLYWENRVKQWTTKTTDFTKIASYIFARDFQHIFEAIGDHLAETSHCIQYVTPLRATAERYYRSQGLSVDEIDPQGTNLAMFLKNLSDEQANSFAEWTAQAMGFEVRAEDLQGHVSVVLSDPGKLGRVNLADTGFGYSQVLPILAQLWRSTNSRPSTLVPQYFAIEQPELHLHPRMQARLADLFAEIASISKVNKRTYQFKLIIETHSETIINQLGKSVEKGVLSPEDVGIYIFNKDGLEGDTQVRESRFDEDGFLIDWPYGFFDITG